MITHFKNHTYQKEKNNAQGYRLKARFSTHG